MLKKKKIIVSGAKGFIGYSLIKHLSTFNDIVAIDNLLHAPNSDEVTDVRYIDIGVSEAINELKGEEFDIFFHFGEYSRVEQSVAEPMTAFENSSASILKILNFCSSKNIKLIYSGSSTKFASYTDNNESPYAIFKRHNTEIINMYAKLSDLNYAITYFYNVYGPDESDDPKYGTVIKKYPDLVRSGQKKLPVTLPGSQKRNFTHIADTVSALMLIAEKGSGDGFGICASESYSILEVVNLLNCEAEWFSAKVGNRDGAVDMSLKTKALGWKQSYTLEKFLKEQLDEIQ